MKILVDTQILIWYGKNELPKMAPKAIPIIQNFNYRIYFSSISLWEVGIKSSLNKPDFDINPEDLANGLIYDGFEQLFIKNKHLFEIKNLPQMPKHKDPFDRLLIAQAKSEHCQFLTVDEKILAYPYDFIIK